MSAAGPGHMVRTVRGPVDPARLGITTTHEHLWMDSTPLLAVHGYATTATGPWDGAIAAEARWNPGAHPDNYRLTDVDVAVDELRPFVRAGGGTIVELTPPSMGQDASRVLEIAQRTDVHVVLGTGQYLAPVQEAWIASSSVEGVTRRLLETVDHGIAETGIRPGIFGEIGTSDPVQPAEVKVLRAVAAASATSGLAISVHLHPWGHEGRAVLDVLTGAGAESTRVILGHANTAIDRPDELRVLADRGATLGFDLFGFDHSLLGPGRWPPSDRDVVAVVAALVQDGYGDRIVLGQDVGVRTRLRRWGGWGYAHLLEHVVPLLRDFGVEEHALDAMLVRTPARLLATPIE
jgi:phosphotriesterase-related protein